MDAGLTARPLQVQIEDIRNGDPPRFDSAHVIECRIFWGAPTLWMCPIILLEVVGWRAGNTVLLTSRQQEVQMGLGLCAVHGCWAVKRIGDGQTVARDALH